MCKTNREGSPLSEETQPWHAKLLAFNPQHLHLKALRWKVTRNAGSLGNICQSELTVLSQMARICRGQISIQQYGGTIAKKALADVVAKHTSTNDRRASSDHCSCWTVSKEMNQPEGASPCPRLADFQVSRETQRQAWDSLPQFSNT